MYLWDSVLKIFTCLIDGSWIGLAFSKGFVQDFRLFKLFCLLNFFITTNIFCKIWLLILSLTLTFSTSSQHLLKISDYLVLQCYLNSRKVEAFRLTCFFNGQFHLEIGLCCYNLKYLFPVTAKCVHLYWTKSALFSFPD